MKVCFLAGTLGQGGAERQLFYMLQALKTSGVETRLICLTKNELYQSKIESLGIKVDFVGEKNNRAWRLAKIVGNLRVEKPDIIQSSHFYTNIYAAFAGKLLNIKSVGAVRNDLRSEIAADRIFGKWQARLPDNLIANSLIALERAEKFGIAPKKLNFVKNVVNLPFSEKSEFKKDKNIVNILFVGRLTQQKRPNLFVALVNHFKQNPIGQKLHFQVIGDGSLLNDLKQTARKLDLSDEDITFYGNRQDVANFYQNADLLVMTSIYEGTPNVILEAMSFGVPVIATRVGGIPDIVSEERGILVEPNDIETLFTETKKLILNENLRNKLGEEGKRYVSENHSLDYLKDRLTGIYEKITK